MKKIGIIILFLLLFQLNNSAEAGLRIDQPKLRLSISPGTYESGEINVENTESIPLDVRVYLEDWVFTAQDGSKEFYPKGTMPLSCSNWISFYPAEFKLQPNATQKVRYTINVPADAIGMHNSVMFFEVGGNTVKQLNEQGEEVNLKILHRLGALIYIESEGTLNRAGEVNNIKITQNLNDVIVSVDFLNSGNADIAAKGTFNILDAEGYVYARGEFDYVYTFPKDKAELKARSPQTSLSQGSYDILVTLEYEQGGALVQEAHFEVGSDGSVTSLTLK